MNKPAGAWEDERSFILVKVIVATILMSIVFAIQNQLVSRGPVKIHVQHIISKLGVSDRTQAAC
jgi:hypothetical protein